MEHKSHMKKQKQYYDWKLIDAYIERIGTSLNTFKQAKYITGIPRGGLIPAVIISHRFGLEYISLNKAKTLPTAEKKRVVVVDDISDTGHTLKQLDTHGFITATLTYRQSTTHIPDIFGTIADHDDWLVFPWEAENAKTIQDYLIK